MKRFRVVAISVCLVLVMIFLTGGISCTQQFSTPTTTSAPTSTTAATSSTSTPQYGGTLKIITPTTVTTFGYPPQMRPDGEIYSYGCLENMDYFDLSGEFSPRLATKWDVAQDGKSITLTLRQGVKFQDGTDFNADAAKSNLDLIRKASGALHNITSIDVIDPYTIRLNLDQYNNLLPTYLGTMFGKMISPTALEKNGQDWALTHPIGTGPYKLADFQRDVYVKYTRFDDYWGGKPYLDGFEYDFKADYATALMAFKAGEGQIMMNVQPKDADSLKAQGYNVVHVPSTEQFLAPSSKNADSPFAKLQVREAVAYAINRDAIVKGPGYGYWSVTDTLVPPESFGHNASLAPRTFDPAKAKQLLAEAGYPTGIKTTLYAQTPIPDSIVPIVTYLKEAGIDATLQQVTATSMASMMKQGWEGLLFNGTGIDPNVLNRIQGDLGVPQGQFVSTLRPAEFQTTLDAAIAATDSQTRKTLTEKLDKVVYDDATFIPLYRMAAIAAFDKTVQNCDLFVNHFVHWHPEKVWLSK